jgi:DNA-binding NtrC family response regulator
MERDQNINPIKLLIVDDEEGFGSIMTKRMGKRKINVTVALSGTEGIQILRKKDFDAAILDLKMEDMDGIDVLNIFKIMCPDMPVIMLTGHGSEQAVKEGIACGAYDYLTKPCELDMLVEKILGAINAKDGRNG